MKTEIQKAHPGSHYLTKLKKIIYKTKKKYKTPRNHFGSHSDHQHFITNELENDS